VDRVEAAPEINFTVKEILLRQHLVKAIGEDILIQAQKRLDILVEVEVVLEQ
jgi:hypothetical protein